MTRSKETYDGGYNRVLRLIERDGWDTDRFEQRLRDHMETPRWERGPYWTGMRDALQDELNRRDPFAV
jgi:hypothetical protein